MVTIMEIISSPLLLFLVVIGLMYITGFSMVEFPEEKYKFLGPSVYERTAEDFPFVKGDRPLIYISLGTVLKGAVSFFQNCIEAFRDEDADVIISKGMGNYEALNTCKRGNVWFCLVAKCEIVAQLTDSKKGAILCIER